jgi:hypothetical protein
MKKKLMIWVGLIGLLVVLGLGMPEIYGAVKPGTRDDGLTVMKLELPKGVKPSYCFLTLVLKNGYADDPAGKAGLTGLTNQLLYQLFSNTSAIDVQYETLANFSQFYFLVPIKNYPAFCNEWDRIIRMEALMMYDECRAIIKDYINEPNNPGILGLEDLYKLLYGNGHPYQAVFNGNLPVLDISTVNDWFRKTYRPSNMVIATTADLPADFLMKPSGRDLKQSVTFTQPPQASCAPRPIIHWTQVKGGISSIFIGFPGAQVKDNDFFSMMVLKRYLQKELWNQLREEMGLCYDVQVSYSYLRESAAPAFIISLETLPADADIAIAKIIDILQQVMVKNSITTKRLSLIQEQEKIRMEHQDTSYFQKLDGMVYEKLLGVAWLKDSKEYLKGFNKVTTDDLAKLMAARIKYVKIAVARPNSETAFEETAKVLSNIEK